MGMLTTTAGRVEKKEGMRGRNTEELNQDQTPDRGRAQSLDRVLTDLPPILLPDPHCHLVQLFIWRWGGPTQDSVWMGGGGTQRNRG